MEKRRKAESRMGNCIVIIASNTVLAHTLRTNAALPDTKKHIPTKFNCPKVQGITIFDLNTIKHLNGPAKNQINRTRSIIFCVNLHYK